MLLTFAGVAFFAAWLAERRQLTGDYVLQAPARGRSA